MAVLVWLLLTLPGGKGAEQVMLPNEAKVHRPVQADDRRAFTALPQTLLVADSPIKDPADLLQRFAGAAASEPDPFRAHKPFFILTPGPVLDGPDKVLVRSVVLRESQVHVEIVHTAVRLQDVPLRRNVRWRPVVEVPLKLPAGRFQIKVTWRAVDGLPDGKPLGPPPASSTLEVEVQPGD